jgi:arylsulfatase A-like enzyme
LGDTRFLDDLVLDARDPAFASFHFVQLTYGRHAGPATEHRRATWGLASTIIAEGDVLSPSRTTVVLGLLGLVSAVAGVRTFIGRGPNPPAEVSGPPPARPRNAVIVVLDAARAQSFGTYGGRRAVTPFVDALSAESVVFEQAFTPAVYTRAAMSALWTSRPPGEPGLRKAPRLAEILSARGFETAGFIGNPNAGRTYGHARGFAEFRELEGTPPPPGEKLVELFAAFLERTRGRFFTYVHVREPHFPFHPPTPFSDRFGPPRLLPREAFTDPDWLDSLNRRGNPTPGEIRDFVSQYEANLAYADHVVGRLRSALETAGRWDETVFVVTADHGEALGEHGFVGHNQQVYAESAQVPLVVRVPGLGAARLGRMASLLDLAPTLAVLLGAGDAASTFRGVDLLAPEAGPERGLRCIAADGKAVAWRDPRYTLVVSGGRAALFDRREDPGETHDRARDKPEVVARLAEALRGEWPEGLELATDEGSVPDADTASLLRALGYVR